MSKCSTCKKEVAVQFDSDWKVDKVLCEYEPKKFKLIDPQTECIDYEPNLHDHCTAPNRS